MKNFFNNLRRYKVSSTLNILGLGIAFAAAFIILVQVNFDLTYNRCFKDADRVYRLEMTSFILGNSDKWMPHVSHTIGKAIGEDNDNVESYGYTAVHFNSTTERKWYVPRKDREDELVRVKSIRGSKLLPETMGYEIIAGSYEQLPPWSMLLSESFARKYGLEVEDVIKDKNNVSFTVKGIYKDFAENCILSGNDIFYWAGDGGNSWEFTYYYKLIDKEQEEDFLISAAQRLVQFIPVILGDKNWVKPEADDREGWLSTANKIIRLTPLYGSYFAKDLDGIVPPTTNPVTTYTLLSIAVLILVIAFINFVNFFMAMVPRRIRRVNTEKVFGCSTWRLRLGFVGEAVGLVVLALLLAAYIIFMVAPKLTDIVSSSAALEDNPKVILIITLSGLLLAVASSIYPAYYITSVPAAFALKGSFGNTASGRRMRYVLLTIQFVISIVLITCSLFIRMQYSYMRNYDMGFNREHILTANLSEEGVVRREHLGMVHWDYNLRQQFTHELKANPMITDVTFAASPFISEIRSTLNLYKENGDAMSIQCYDVAYNFMDFMGINVNEGRGYRAEDEQPTYVSYIFNETARNQYGLTLNEKFINNKPGMAIGFCDDFKYRSLQLEMLPFAFSVKHAEGYLSQLYIRTAPNADIEAVRKHIYDCMTKMGVEVTPEDVPIEFFDEELGRQYEKERELNRLITIFALISICISLMGVFGLVFFETQYRRREIAVRRVHGASIKSILMMFAGQYARMVGIAFLFAVPVSYLIMHRWLQSFAYHIPLYWWVFALALLIVLAITSTIVLARSWRAARENPVNSLYKE